MTAKIWEGAFCLICVNFNNKLYGSCKAFPDGIPHSIVSGETSHFLNIIGDNGIKFDRIEKRESR